MLPSPLFRNVGLGLTLLSLSAMGQAAALSLTTTDPVLTGLTGTVSGDSHTYADYWWDGSTTSTTALVDRVQLAPTKTEAGLAYTYQVTTVTETSFKRNYFYDVGSQSLAVTGNASGSKFLTWSGSLSNQSASAVAGWLQLSVDGGYASDSGPFGATVPALPSLYVRHQASDAWTALDVGTITNAATQTFSSTAAVANWSQLAAGSSLNFELGVLAGASAQLGKVTLSFQSDRYGFWDSAPTVTVNTYEQLVGAKVLAPVPEPQAYALMLCGLAALGLLARRRSLSQG